MKASEKPKENLQKTDIIKVLIADDDPPTRILLRAAISQWGYEVIEASNGEEAWQILQQPNAPRLLILDWLMPKLDGISLCERIKQTQTFHPYTILLTQVTGTTNIIKGLEAGADEFLSKPFNMAELRSRLSVGARIIRFENILAEQKSKVQSYASQMEILSQSHAKQLVYHADLLVLLGSLIENISAEIYDALAKITSTGQSPNIILEKVKDLQHNLASAITIMKRLQVHSNYSPKTQACNINELIQNALSICVSATRHLKIELKLLSPLPSIAADKEQLQEMFLALILSAVAAIKDQDHPYLHVESKVSNDKNNIEIIMKDSGSAIPDSELQAMLNSKQITDGLEPAYSRLSMAMSKETVEKYGGSLLIENQPQKNGISLSIKLPLPIKNAKGET